MDQNPHYFPGYYTKNRKIDVEGMDAMLLERCAAWVLEKNAVISEAALREYIDVVIDLIELDGKNPRHRHDVQEQALSTIDVLVNKQGRNSSLFANQETRMYMREQFLKGISTRLFDRKFENSYLAPDPQIDRHRTQMRENFKVVLNVDPTVFSASEAVSNASAGPRLSSAEQREAPRLPSRIRIEFSDARQGRDFYSRLTKEAKKNNWKMIIGFTESGNAGTLETFPKDNNAIMRADNPEIALRAILQPIENYLIANGCTQGATIADDPRWKTVQWRQKEAHDL